jgi:hypothetical protein
MIRIIIGVLLILGTLSSLAQSAAVLSNSYELQGFIFGKVVIIALSIWLIYSGVKKRKAHEEKRRP